MNMEITKEEAALIVQLCDLALRVKGLEAQGVLPLARKFQEAFDEKIEEP